MTCESRVDGKQIRSARVYDVVRLRTRTAVRSPHGIDPLASTPRPHSSPTPATAAPSPCSVRRLTIQRESENTNGDCTSCLTALPPIVAGWNRMSASAARTASLKP